MPQPLKVLMAEDNFDDAGLVLLALQQAGFEPECHRVDTEAEYLERLHGGLDLVLSDYEMPQFSGLRALELLKRSGLEVPFILVSGTIGEDTAVAAMKLGAADYLLKDRLARLGAAVTHALTESRSRRERRQKDEELVHSREEVEQGYEDLKREVSERKKVEEQLRQTQKMEAIGTLAGGIAHDFNNILAAIGGYTELAQMKLQGNPEVREYLGAALKASRRAADLVRQILTFSRQQPLQRQTIQLQPLVAETVKLLRATIPSTIDFDMSLALDAPNVLADTTQVHQVLMNLGTNAWHAMKDQAGRLQVKLERYAVDAAIAATQPRLRPGVYARVSVSDTGPGMDSATLRRIFEPFFTTKPPGEGTGLGLAVVQGIMDTHDGAITVYSQPGEGTIFHLYFPAHAGEVTAPPAEAPLSPGQGEQILFVDDEEMLLQLGQQMLTELGYQVEVATRPAAALALVQADPSRFALVLTDLTMPGMTGLQFAEQLLKIRPGLPIVLTTGYSASLTAERVQAAGICQFLLKPIGLHSLGTAVHAALSGQSPA
jgi:signal transduction histidine kinase